MYDARYTTMMSNEAYEPTSYAVIWYTTMMSCTTSYEKRWSRVVCAK
mgnify:CR=1 FL=1